MSSFVEPVKQHHWANMNYIIEPNKQLQKPLDDISFRIWEIIEPIWKTTEPIRITIEPLWITLLSQYEEHFWANMKNFHKPSGSLAHLAQFWLNLGKFGSLARLALRWLSFFFSKYRADEPGVIFFKMLFCEYRKSHEKIPPFFFLSPWARGFSNAQYKVVQTGS